MSDAPYTFGEARRVMHDASQRQVDAETKLAEAHQEVSDTRNAYRRSRAERMVMLHNEGVAWTVCDQLASGSPEVAQARHAFDIAQGKLEACQQALYRLSADRRSALALCDWSMRRELAEGGA